MKSKSTFLTAAALSLVSLPALAQTPSAAPPAQQREVGVMSKIFSNEEKVQLSAVPENVQKTIAAYSHGGKVDEVEKESKDGKPIYEAKVKTSGDQKIKMKIEEDGTLVAFRYGHKEEKDVSFSDIPKSAQKTITDVVHGAKVTEVEKETRDGETLYEAKVKTSDDRETEIKVNENGDLRELKTEKDFF